MEYLEGGTLFAYLKQNKTLPEEEVAVKIADVASAIETMEAVKVAHRDIKPENIVMSNVICLLL